MGKMYANDFKVMIVELLKSGRKVSELSKEYTLAEGMLRRWRREYESKLGDFSKKKELSPIELELRQLKKELSNITMERDILKKAISIFSKSDR